MNITGTTTEILYFDSTSRDKPMPIGPKIEFEIKQFTQEEATQRLWYHVQKAYTYALLLGMGRRTTDNEQVK